MPLLKKQPSFKLWIALAMFVAYLPVSSFYFAVKNDFFTGYFPAKWFLSAQLQSGEIPTWNPFINYGFPMFGDMSVAYWSPSNWFFGAIGYNTYSFTAELLLYLLLSGYGMFLVSGLWLKSQQWRYVLAIAYMCSGFNVSHLQHFNWITAAALLPYCFYFLHQLMKNYQPAYLVSATFFFSLYISSVHPGMIIGALFFFVFFGIRWIINSNNRPATFMALILFLLFLAILSCGVIWGYTTVLPYTNRFNPVHLDQLNEGATTGWSWISVLLPFAVMDQQAIFTDDIALRSSYMGLLPLAALTCLTFKKHHPGIWHYCFVGLAFLCLSAPILADLYHHIPLINTVRLRAEFRLFAIFAFLLTAAQIIQSSNDSRALLRKPLQLMLSLVLIAVACSTVFVLMTRQSIIFRPLQLDSGFIGNLKTIIHSLSFADKVILQGILQSIILSAYIFDFSAAMKGNFWKLASAELVLATLMNMPFTGVGVTSLPKVNDLISRAPKQSIIVSSTPEKDIVATFPSTDSVINSWSFYSKQVAQKDQMLYPLILRNTVRLFSSHELQSLQEKPFFFSENGSEISVISSSVRKFSFKINASHPDTIVIKQNYFKGWTGYADGQETPVLQTYQTFMGIAVDPGIHTVTFTYENKTAINLLIVYQLLMAGLALYILYYYYRMRYILP